jgi:hypothetical protein
VFSQGLKISGAFFSKEGNIVSLLEEAKAE